MTELEIKVNDIDKRQESFETFIRANIEATRDHINKIDERMDKFEAKHDADMQEIRQEMKNIGRNTQNIAIATMIGIGAISVSVIGFAWSLATR